MRRTLHILLLTTFLLCLQAITLRAVTRLTSRMITTQDGLPSNQVQAMLQDPTGYIWIGTNNGLCRYDGYATVNFQNVGQAERSTRGDVGTLYLDERNAMLWMRTATFNYACYDLRKRCFTNFSAPCDPQKTFHRFVTEPGGIWMYEQGTGIRHVTCSDGHFTCKDFSQEDCLQVKQLVADEGRGVWAITADGLFYITNDGKMKQMLTSHILAGSVWGDDAFFLTDRYEVKVFRDGRLVKATAVNDGLAQRHRVGASAGMGLPLQAEGVNGTFVWQDQWVILMRSAVITMDCRKLTFQCPQDLQMAFGIILDQTDGDYWVSDRDNALHFFPKTGAHKVFHLLNDVGYSIARKRRFSTAKGAGGKYYIATYGNGLFVYDSHTERMIHYSAADGQPLLASNYLTGILCDRDGGIWVSQEDAGLVYIKEVEQPEADYVFPAAGSRGEMVNYISQLQPQADGSVMIGTRSRITFRYVPATNTIQRVGMADFDILPVDSVTDQYGRTWKATWEQGLTLISPQSDGTTKQQHFLNRSTNESRINAISMDSQQRLWIATSNGLYWVHTAQRNISDDSFKNHNASSGLPSNQLLCVMATAGDTIWTGGVGTGIVRCVLGSDGQVQTAVVGAGQKSDNVHSLVCDRKGNIWAGGDEAIIRVQPQQMKAVAYRPGTSFLNRIYSKNCALRLDDGRLMFGTHDGITLITPSDDFSIQDSAAQDAPFKRKPIITDIQVKGRSVSPLLPSHGSLKLNLPHDENSLTICFSCLDYAHAGEVMYRCYMEGADQEWREPSPQHRIDYNNLPPGKYLFHVKTTEDSDETLLAITILQPWWNTWWAWMLYLLFFAAAAYTFYRHRREQFLLHQQLKVDKELMDMRTRLFTSITHEFRTPLAIIKGGVDKLAVDSSNRAAMQTVSRGTTRLLRIVNQFIEFRKIRTGSLRIQVEQADIVGFVKSIVDDFRPMAEQKDISLTFTPSTRHHAMPFDKQHVESIVYNLLSNAVKYTPERGTVKVNLRFDDLQFTIGRQLLLSVSDSGPGISDGQQSALFKPFLHGLVSQGGMGIGLYTAYETAKAHKGSLAYGRSTELGGSTFVLTLPADNSAYEAKDFRDVTAIDTQSSGEETPQSINELIRELQPQAYNDITVAIVEDDPDMMLQISAEVGVYFRTLCFSNGQAALDALLQGVPEVNVPALLICDVMLPDMNGYDIVRRIKDSAATATLPVIMLTALDDETHQIKAYQAGADDYMVKPCNFRLLMARAIQLIKWRQSLSPVSNFACGQIQEYVPTPPNDQTTNPPSDQTTNPPSDQTANPPNDQTTNPPIPQIITSRADKVFLDKLAMHTAQHISDGNFTLDALAQMMNMGRTKFFGKVKELTGLSPNKYVLEARMRHAADLLAEGELTVAEVCYKVGIQDPSYFNKLFKAAYGVPPSKYKREA